MPKKKTPPPAPAALILPPAPPAPADPPGAAPPFQALPSTSLYHELARPELQPILHTLTEMIAQRDHTLVFNITGTFGSGRTTALQALQRTARAQGARVCFIDIDDIRTHYPGPRTNPAIQEIFRQIGTVLELDLGEQLHEQPGLATLQNLAQAIRDAVDTATLPPLVLLFDNGDGLLPALENILFRRLQEIDRRGIPVLVVVASRQEVRWQVLTQATETLALVPLTVAQTVQQLGCDAPTASRLHPITAGLAGANSRLADLGLLQAPPATQLARIFAEFVLPVLSSDPILNEAVKAAALLNQGFGVDEFRRAVQMVSYVRGRYREQDRPFFYTEIDRLYSLGLLTYHNATGTYHMEPHLAGILDSWNRFNTRPDEDAANRQAIQQIYQQSLLPPEEETAPDLAAAASPGAAAYAAAPLPPVPSDLSAAYAYIEQHTAGDPSFVGRERAVRDIARYLCRQPGYEADILFLQAGAGSGKTALLHRCITLAREAAQAYPSSGLLVIRPQFGVDQEPPLDPLDGDELDFSGSIHGLIDLEFSATNRLGQVRRAIRTALLDTLVEESTSPDQDPAARRAQLEQQYFGRYDQEQQAWETLRNDLREGPTSAARIRLVQEKRAQVRSTQKNLDRAFFEACRHIARSDGRTLPRRRVLLVFDTYDYPVRSGLSATQFISEIAARLAGDYFFLIACRPPIPAELLDPYIGSDLCNYLPDDLREQAVVMDLDRDHRLRRADIIQYYQQRLWYQEAAQRSFVCGARRIRRDTLVAALAAIVDERGGLPVLLSLLEFYVGLHQGRMPERLLNDPADLRAHSDDEFKRALVDSLLRNMSGPGTRISEPHQWALLLMSVVDRGVSKRLLDLVHPLIQIELSQRESAPPLPSAAAIWAAILDIAQAEVVAPADPATAPTLQVHSTLIKIVQSTRGKIAFKLHDYLSSLFNYYISWRVQRAAPAEYGFALNLIRERQLIVRAVIEYMSNMAEQYRPEERVRIETPQQARRLRIYQASRSSQVYYGIRLAAIQYEDLLRGESPPEDRTLPQTQLVHFKSDQLIARLRRSQDAAHTAELVFGYLYGKVIREISEYMEYGFGEMILQEVRYHLYDPGDSSRITQFTIPLIDDIRDEREQFASARHLYYAALLSWEYASGQYPTAEPWLETQPPSRSRLRGWRLVRVWREITALLQLEEPTHAASHRTYQLKYADWLREFGYATRAHEAYALLAIDAVGEEYARLLMRQARAAIANPALIYYRDSNGRLDRTIRGLTAAERYLHNAIVEEDLSPAVRVEVHYTYAWLCRILERLDWTVPPTEEPNGTPQAPSMWGALHHYYEALKLLRTATPHYRTLDYAIALNGYSFILTLLGELEAAEDACRKGLSILAMCWSALSPQAPDEDQRPILDAHGRAYSTLGEITRYKAEATRGTLESDQHYQEALRHYKHAESYFEPGNREWHAILVMERAPAAFWYEVARVSGQPAPDAGPLQGYLDEMYQALYSLLPKDKPDGYRRLARMFLQMARARHPAPAHLPFKRDTLSIEARHFADHLDGWALQAYICAERGYEIATRINNTINRLLLTSDTVELLAEQVPDPRIALEFYRMRARELDLDRVTPLTFRRGGTIGLSLIAIGMAYLREAQRLPADDPSRRASQQQGAHFLVSGFQALKLRSTARLRALIVDLETHIDDLDDTMGYVYGELKSLQFGDRWPELLSKMSRRLNAQLY